MPQALILGCGDLGRRLADRLIADGFDVTGVRRSVFSLPGGRALSLDLAAPRALEQLPSRVDVVVIALTPAERTPEAYRATFVDLPRRVAGAVSAPRWVFVSSTAVYGQNQATLPDGWIDEHVDPVPDRFNGQVLLEAEQCLRERVPRLTALRCTGLYGPGRSGLLARALRGEAGDSHWTNRIRIEDAARAAQWCVTTDAPPAQVIATDLLPLRECDALRALRSLGQAEEGSNDIPDESGSGRRFRPQVLLDAGFQWCYPDLMQGYRDLVSTADDSPRARRAL
ncbi:MAG: NAD-dependent epimerase/dehydratase family protein [Lysobacteraceae bacterium]